MLKFYNFYIYIVENIANIIIVLIYNLNYFFMKSSLPIANKDTINVIGNGPSLKLDIDKIIINNCNDDNLVVNMFAESSNYEILKPSYYLLVDPAYFINDLKLYDLQINLANFLINKTTWPINFLVPHSSRNSNFIKKIKTNLNIKIFYILNIPIVGGSNILNSLLFKLKLANPLYQNVLIAGIFLSLQLRYKNINIWGSDHSWHEQLSIGNNNEIYINDLHFYDLNRSNVFIHKNFENKNLKLHEIFNTFSRAFKTYHLLYFYSNKLKINIYNMCGTSWIDAFNRQSK